MAAQLTVLIPVGPGPRPHFGATLDSLASDFPAIEGSVLTIFDGTSPDVDEHAALRQLGARWLCLDKQPTLAHVLNQGLRQVNTELISRLDADDLWMPGRLGEQLRLMADHPTHAAAGSHARTIDAAGAPVGQLRAGAGPDLRSALIWRNQLLHPTVVFRTDLARRVGGYPEVSRMEDYGLWLALALHGDLATVETFWASYRLHPGQLSSHASTPEARALVLRRRRDLARSLGKPPGYAHAAHTAWSGAQWLSHRGINRAWSRFETERATGT
ncbi:MAG: glycosyltransferase [Kineosporiaceae bacterium]|nr:glycosyltransferase [Kineosporiaceae bacterium]